MVFVKNKLFLLFFVLSLFIVILLISIFTLDKSSSTTNNTELNSLITKVRVLEDDPQLAQHEYYKSTLELLKLVGDEKLSELQQYKTLATSADRIQLLYISTNNPRIRKIFSQDMAEYAKKHYPKYYDKDFFQYPCQDPTCAQNTHSQKITPIIENVKKTDFSDFIKQGIIHDLITTGYREENDKDSLNGKVNQYLNIALDIKSLTAETKNESNIKIGNEIQEFIKSEYPERYTFLKERNSILTE